MREGPAGSAPLLEFVSSRETQALSACFACLVVLSKPTEPNMLTPPTCAGPACAVHIHAAAGPSPTAVQPAYLVGRCPAWHVMPRLPRFSATWPLHSSSNLHGTDENTRLGLCKDTCLGLLGCCVARTVTQPACVRPRSNIHLSPTSRLALRGFCQAV